jgi:hypothetical protein
MYLIHLHRPRYSGACALSLASALTGGGTVDGGSLVLGALSALSGTLTRISGPKATMDDLHLAIFSFLSMYDHVQSIMYISGLCKHI